MSIKLQITEKCIEDVRNLKNTKYLRKLKIIHRQIFGEKLFLPELNTSDDESVGTVYTCQISGSKKIRGMCQIVLSSPEAYFDTDRIRENLLFDDLINRSDKSDSDECNDVRVFHKNSRDKQNKKTVYLMDFGIISSDRRKGIGTTFMNNIKTSLLNKEYDIVNLHIQNGYKLKKNVVYKKMDVNHIINFYKKSGFKVLDNNNLNAPSSNTSDGDSSGEWFHPDKKRRYLRMFVDLHTIT